MSSPPRRAAVLVRTPLAMRVALEVMAELNEDRARASREREARRRAEQARPDPARASSRPPPNHDD